MDVVPDRPDGVEASIKAVDDSIFALSVETAKGEDDVSVRFALAETEGDTPDGITVDREPSVEVDLAVRLDEVSSG